MGRREGLLRAGAGEVGQHEPDGGQRDDHGEIGTGTAQIEELFVEFDPAEEEAEADHAGEDDHNDRIHRVARQGGLSALQHKRGNHEDLEADHGESEDHGAVRLAEALGENVGMTHHGESGQQDGQANPDKKTGGGQRRGKSGDPSLAVEHPDQRGSPDEEQGPLIAPKGAGRTHGAALNRRDRLLERTIGAKVIAVLRSAGFVGGRSGSTDCA